MVFFELPSTVLLSPLKKRAIWNDTNEPVAFSPESASDFAAERT